MTGRYPGTKMYPNWPIKRLVPVELIEAFANGGLQIRLTNPGGK